MFAKISHIGVAVKDLAAASQVFEKLFGKNADHVESVPEHKVRTALFRIGESNVELTQATDPESPIARFIEKRGEGMHHISFVVDDIDRELTRLKDLGFQLLDDTPRLGADGYRVAFLHPRWTNGVLIEICQKA